MKTPPPTSIAASTETNPAADVSQPSVSVVVPVYNGAATLEELCRRLDAALSACTGRHELILVNDGSRDKSWPLIEMIARSHPDVRGVNLARNYGQHNALLAGIREARCELTVTIDDDLQNPPEEVPRLLAALGPDCDVVYGEPIAKRQRLGRRLATQLIVRALSILGGKTAPMVSSFRAFRTELRDGFGNYTGPDVSIDGLLTWQTERFRSVPVNHETRARGESNYSLLKLVRHALTMITAFSTRPLQIASGFGFVVIVFGLVVLAYVALRFLIEGTTVPGFPFLASIISIFAGAQLFAIGVIGTYLARVHVRTMSRPSYAIRERAEGTPAGVTPRASNGAEPCRLLPWDSEFWGFPVARATSRRLGTGDAERVAAWCNEHGIRCAYLLAGANDAVTAEAAASVGFRYVDTRLTLENDSTGREASSSGTGQITVRPARPDDDGALAHIAARAHTDSRFFFDTRFSRSRASELYAAWVHRGFHEEERRLLVAERDGVVAGYLLLDEEEPGIDLIAVAEASRGQGIGTSLIVSALQESPDTPLKVVTQGRNTAALRLYEDLGFRVVDSESWYHLWP